MTWCKPPRAVKKKKKKEGERSKATFVWMLYPNGVC